MNDPSSAARAAPAPAFAPATPPDHAVPAATVIVRRAGQGNGADEVLLLRRTPDMTFAPGAMVFPGGRVDADDHVVARHIADARFAASATPPASPLDPDDAAARVAAIRETLEETGLTVGMTLARATDREALRQALLDGQPLSEWVARGDLVLDLDALVPFARWCPNFRETRTFDTRFYLATVERGAGDAASFVAREHDSLGWTTPDNALTAIDAGAMTVIFPTHRNLERLAAGSETTGYSVASAPQSIPLIVPFVDERDGVKYLCIPTGLGYPVTAVPLKDARRT